MVEQHLHYWSSRLVQTFEEYLQYLDYKACIKSKTHSYVPQEKPEEVKCAFAEFVSRKRDVGGLEAIGPNKRRWLFFTLHSSSQEGRC